MKTLEIPVKFQRDDTLYTTKQIKVETSCSICEGTGRITYNEKDMKCPECMGIGKLRSNKNINIVCDEPYIISTTKININNDGVISVKYNGYCGLARLNRDEHNLFSTKEEAQIRCDKLNKERTLINVADIVIQESFKETQPSIEKIQAKLDYYKANKKFNKEIVINKENILQDGYITYLLCKLFNINIIRVVVENIS